MTFKTIVVYIWYVFAACTFVLISFEAGMLCILLARSYEMDDTL